MRPDLGRMTRSRCCNTGATFSVRPANDDRDIDCRARNGGSQRCWRPSASCAEMNIIGIPKPTEIPGAGTGRNIGNANTTSSAAIERWPKNSARSPMLKRSFSFVRATRSNSSDKRSSTPPADFVGTAGSSIFPGFECDGVFNRINLRPRQPSSKPSPFLTNVSCHLLVNSSGSGMLHSALPFPAIA